MFTGLIEGMGTVKRVLRTSAGAHLEIGLGPLADGVKVGDSIAIDGCCLTVVALDGDTARFDAVPETLDRTTLGALERDVAVNLERALRAEDRLGGHFVSGHVDAVAEVEDVAARGLEVDLFVAVPAELRRFAVEKGSATLAGVSLTIASLTESGFRVAVIPHTLQATTLGRARAGTRLNFEADLLGKWVARLLESRGE